MSTPTPTEPGTGRVALMLLAVLPIDRWLTEDDVQDAADTYLVPARNVGALMRELRRDGWVRHRPGGVEDSFEWQVTPSGVDAAEPHRPT